MEPYRGDGPVDDDLPEITDEQVDRVQQKKVLHHGIISVYVIEDGGQIAQELRENGPQVLDIPEKDEKGG